MHALCGDVRIAFQQFLQERLVGIQRTGPPPRRSRQVPVFGAQATLPDNMQYRARDCPARQAQLPGNLPQR